MKIAFVVETFPVLSQTFVLNQIIGLMEQGHEVDIYAESQENITTVHSDIEKYNLLQHTFYHPKIPRNWFLRLIRGVGLFLRYLPIAPLLILRSLNVFKYQKDAASLRLLYAVIPFARQRPAYNIIQCHFGMLGIKGMLLRDVGAIQGKLLTTFHGVDISQNLKLLGENVYNDLFEVGDHFLPISYHWQKRLIELGCDPAKITVHHMGIDCQRFTFVPRSLPPKAPVRLISVARLTEKKGIEFGIRAVAIALESNPHLEYTIVGDGELHPQLTQLIQSLGIAEQVKLLGWRNQHEVVELLHQSHIFLAPSVTAQDGNQEGIPVALMEAMAMGLPVISTYHTGIPELVADGVSGFLVPERDVVALAQKLILVVQQSPLWAEICHAGRAQVEQQFAIHILNQRLVEIYQSLLPSGQADGFSETINGQVRDSKPLDASAHPISPKL